MQDLLEEVLKNDSGFRVALFATVAWCLWQRRNRVRERQPSWHLHEIGEQALALVHEFWEVHKQEARTSVQQTPVRWSPPPDTCFKCNFDAALFDGSEYAAIGVVFRDSSGNVIAALSQRIDYTSLIELAEALVARRAMVFARELGLFDVIYFRRRLSSDCSGSEENWFVQDSVWTCS